MAHEAATFRELQERLRGKQIWVVGAAAIAAATGAHGEGGSKMRGAGMAAALAASDAELFGSPAGMTEAPAAFRAMFAQGLEGYADDRLADGAGWITFDVASIRCPVTVLHSRSDQMADVIHARHTAELIPGANLVIFDDLGHFSIATKVVPAIRALPQRQRRSAEPGRFPAMPSRDIPLPALLSEGETAFSQPGHRRQNRTPAGLAGHAGGVHRSPFPGAARAATLAIRLPPISADIACRRLAGLSLSVMRHHRRVWQR